jgi:hypothetical protein
MATSPADGTNVRTIRRFGNDVDVSASDMGSFGGFGDSVMSEGSVRKVQMRQRSISHALAIVTLAMGVCLLSCNGQAAGPAGPVRSLEVGALLASSDALSDAVMAEQTGTGLRSPAIVPNEQTGAPRVLLWDELKIPLMAPVTSGIMTGGSNH